MGGSKVQTFVFLLVLLLALGVYLNNADAIKSAFAQVKTKPAAK